MTDYWDTLDPGHRRYTIQRQVVHVDGAAFHQAPRVEHLEGQ